MTNLIGRAIMIIFKAIVWVIVFIIAISIFFITAILNFGRKK